jgi:hypothetical protein
MDKSIAIDNIRLAYNTCVLETFWVLGLNLLHY